MTGVVQKTAWIPARQYSRLRIAVAILCPRPDFEVTGFGKINARRPVLPGKPVRRHFDACLLPDCTEINRCKHVYDTEIPRPCMTTYLEGFTSRMRQALLWKRDYRFDGHRFDNAHVFIRHRRARRYRFAGHPVGLPNIFSPSWMRLRSMIFVSHLPLTEADQPAHNNRNG